MLKPERKVEENKVKKEGEGYLTRRKEDEGYLNWLGDEVSRLFEEMKQAEESGDATAPEKRARWDKATRALTESQTAFNRGYEVERKSGF